MSKASEYSILMSIAGKIDQSFLKSLNKVQKHLGVLGTAGGKAFVATAVGATTLISASVAAGKILYDIGSKFDDAQDKIRIGTGATGEALEELVNNAKSVYTQVPTTLEDTSGVIADYNTRLGITGNNLEKLTIQAIQASQALDEDVTSVVENSSRAFKNFNIAEEDMSSSMDYAFKVSQSTGIGFNNLLSTLQTGGAQLQALGFNFNESATLLGQFTKGGYDTSLMLMGLKTTAQQAIKDGFGSTSEAMEAYIERIKNAKSDTEALAIANQKFGSRGGATFVKAIKDGTLNIKDLQTELENSDESINKMANDTYDFPEKWTMFKNRMSVALAPMANNVFEQIGNLMEKIAPILEQRVVPLIEKLQPIFSKLVDLIAPLLEVVISFIDFITPPLEFILGILEKVVGAVSTVLSTGLLKNSGVGNNRKDGVPGLAEGGIVTKPTLAMIGEGGEPEAVIPFSKMGGGNNITYAPNINITGDVSNDRAKEIAHITFDEFKRLYSRMMNENRRLAFATI